MSYIVKWHMCKIINLLLFQDVCCCPSQSEQYCKPFWCKTAYYQLTQVKIKGRICATCTESISTCNYNSNFLWRKIVLKKLLNHFQVQTSIINNSLHTQGFHVRTAQVQMGDLTHASLYPNPYYLHTVSWYNVSVGGYTNIILISWYCRMD